MKTRHYVLVAATIAFAAYLFVGHVEAGRQWVRGASNGALYCYPAGHESKAIQRKVYFDTLESCQATIGTEIE